MPDCQDNEHVFGNLQYRAQFLSDGIESVGKWLFQFAWAAK